MVEHEPTGCDPAVRFVDSWRTVRLLWPLSRIRKNSAEARLPRISRNAMATTMRMEGCRLGNDGLEMAAGHYLTEAAQ